MPSFPPLSDALQQRYDAAAALEAALAADLAGLIAATAGANADDEHDPEGATIAFERAQLQHLLDQCRAQRSDCAAALQRLSDGTYGRCDRCQQVIAPDRLAARPAATRCISCAARP